MLPKQIFLLGAYGQNNLGDDALLEVFLEQLRGARVVVNSAQPAQTRQRYGVETVATYMGWPRFSRLRALLGSGAIVFGGGSLLKEIEGGTVARLLYFVRLFLLLILGRLIGRPTAMLAVGIGPLDRPLYRRLSRMAANFTDLICVRDAESRDLLLSIGVSRPIHVTADPVFLLAGRAEAPHTGDRPTVVVVPRYSLSDAQLAQLAAACDHLVAARGVRVLLVPFQTGYRSQFDDLAAAQSVRARMRHAEAAEVWVPETPGQALEAIGRADLLLSTRLHGLIFASIRGVASVGIGYDVKVQSFMHELGQPWACASLPELESGALPALLDTAWERRRETAAAVAARADELRARSRQSFSRFEELLASPRGGGLLTGGALLLASMTIVNAGNYLSNLVLGRWLGPAAFADFSLMVTAFLIVTLVTATLQTISAKFSAMHAADGDAGKVQAVRAWLLRWAWGIGAATFVVFALGAPLWQQFFHTTSIWPFVILGIGLPFYYVQGIDRGVLQGQTRFGPLAITYQVEMWVRLVGAVALVALGLSVNGAVGGVTISLVAAWLAASWALDGVGWRGRHERRAALGAEERAAIAAFSGPVALALVGQVMINNSDILIVKHFFAAEAAGHYAALALIGRVVFFATISVVAAMFPIVAQKHQRGEPHRHLLWAALGTVAAASSVVILATWAWPELMVRLLFGAAYLPVAPLLWQYAIATMLYALANVVINYRLSVGDGGGSKLVMVAGVAQVAGLWLFHGSLHEVVLVQVVLMIGLFAMLMAWDWRLARRGPQAPATVAASGRAAPKWWPQLRSRWRSLLLGTITLAVLLMAWQVAGAQPTQAGNAAQEQVRQIMPSLRDSEAEQASGAYVPGVGAVLVLDLLRGPNTFEDKPADAGVRDWAVYLLGAFGPRLSAVPPDETIAISITYYDFEARNYRQLVASSRAADVADSGTYAIWLDGQPTNDAARRPRAALADAAAGAAGALSFDDEQSRGEWRTAGGTWEFADGGYAQTELGRYDLVSLLQRPAAGDYTVQVDLKRLDGDMGGGIVFGAPDEQSKSGAHLVNFSEKGAYVQWGSFDANGVFQFKGGSPVPNGGDGEWHTLTVRVTGAVYSVALDGATLVADVPLEAPADGRAGLVASTSHVLFDNFSLEGR